MSNFETWWEREGQEFLFALNTTTDDDIKLVAEVAWKNGAYCAEQAEQEPVIDLSKVRHEDKCRYWDDETFCDCGADSHALLEWHRNNKAAPVQQAEQEPVAIEELAWEKYCEGTAGDMDVRDFWEELPKSVQQRYIAKVSCSYPNCNCPFDHPGGDWCARGLSTNTAPVRTKDLTDQEIQKLRHKIDWTAEWSYVNFARSVIAADREKNK